MTNVADMLGIISTKRDELTEKKILNKDTSTVRRSISGRFDKILEKCPRTKKVRRFIKEWLEGIEDKKRDDAYVDLFD